jgi:hypothetical protein
MKSLAITQGRRASNVAAAVTSVQLFPDAAVSTIPALLTAPSGGGVLDGKPFQVCAAGECTTSGAYNVKVGLYAKLAVPASPLLAASWTKIAESTARAVGTTSAPWFIEAQLCMGSVSGKLQGLFRTMINNLVDAEAALSNAISSLTPASLTVEPALNFCVGIDFSTGATTNIGYLKYFAVEC